LVLEASDIPLRTWADLMEFSALFDFSELLEATVKLTVAALLGAMVGYEREAHGEAAGFRTFILVSMGSCLIMMVSIHLETMYRGFGMESAVRVDPGRIASYALAGMGFLGAGAIIVGRSMVRGLTTAAGLWLMTAVGLAVGSGYLLPAVMATLLGVFVLFTLRRARQWFHRDIYSTIILTFHEPTSRLEHIGAVVEKYPFTRIAFVNFHKSLEKGTITYRLNVISKEGTEWEELTEELASLPGLKEIALEEGRVV
jgi:putative Mg2+ transporter-C (MgtC) family protein